jgi:hypothetical protein
VPSETGALLNIRTLRLTPGDVARGAKELVDFEHAAASSWSDARGDEAEDVRTIVRAALVRLLSFDAWMPGSVRFGGGRLDVRITIELDNELDTSVAEARAELRRQRSIARERLLASLAAQEEDNAQTA